MIFGKGLPRANGGMGRRANSQAGPNGTLSQAEAAAIAAAKLPTAAAAPVAGVSSNRGGNKSIALVNCRNVRCATFQDPSGRLVRAPGRPAWTVSRSTTCRWTPTATASTSTPAATCGQQLHGQRDQRRRDRPQELLRPGQVPGLREHHDHRLRGQRLRPRLRSSTAPTGTEQAKAVDRDGPTGRIKFGTESSGGFRNITISNCVFDRSRGLALETVDGGTIENVTITNIAMRNLCNAAIFLRIGNRARSPAGTPVGRSAACRSATSSPRTSTPATRDHRRPPGPSGRGRAPERHPNRVARRPLARRRGEAAGRPREHGSSCAAAGLAGPRDPFSPPEQEKAYPEPSMFGLLPAYGIYVRHASGLDFRDVDLGFAKDDTRPAIVLDDVAGASFDHVNAQRAGGAPFFVLRKVADFSVGDSSGVPDTRVAAADNQSL
jgi:hypothetical protein